MKYRTIVADPPWEYPEGFVSAAGTDKGRTPQPAVTRVLPYPSMTLLEIQALPLGNLAEADCRLFLWTTNRYLPHAFPVLAAWGFEYAQTLVWHKADPPPFGGSVAPVGAEFLLVARRGKPQRIGRMPTSVLKAPHSQQYHSAKPEAFLDYIEQVSPGPYLELFARRNRLGWDTWGNEALEHVELTS